MPHCASVPWFLYIEMNRRKAGEFRIKVRKCYGVYMIRFFDFGQKMQKCSPFARPRLIGPPRPPRRLSPHRRPAPSGRARRWLPSPRPRPQWIRHAGPRSQRRAPSIHHRCNSARRIVYRIAITDSGNVGRCKYYSMQHWSSNVALDLPGLAFTASPPRKTMFT